MWSTSLSVSYARLSSIAFEGHTGRFSKSHCEPVASVVNRGAPSCKKLLAEPFDRGVGRAPLGHENNEAKASCFIAVRRQR